MKHRHMASPMSEKQRAFLALQGRTFPRVGDRGRYVHNVIDGEKPNQKGEAAVEVLRVTSTGVTVTLKFVEPWAQRCWEGPFRALRRGDGPDGSGWYIPSCSYRELTGEVLFTMLPGVVS